MASDMDFNGADTQDAAFDLIPANTLVRVTLTIRPGGAGPEGWLTQSKTRTALYLNTEAIIMEGPFARRRSGRSQRPSGCRVSPTRTSRALRRACSWTFRPIIGWNRCACPSGWKRRVSI